MPLKLHKTINTLNIDLNTKASTESPSFSGIPTAPTAASGDSSSQLATTEFVMQELTGIDNVFGDVVLGYQDKEGYLPCNGSFAFADDYLEFYNIGVKNPATIQEVQNPASVTNGFFSPEIWLNSEKILTHTRNQSNDNTSSYTRFFTYDYNKITRQFSNPVEANSLLGLPTTGPYQLYLAGAIEGYLFFRALHTSSSLNQAYFWVVELDANGNRVSTQQVTISGLSVGGENRLGSNKTTHIYPYKIGSDIFVHVSHVQDTTPVTQNHRVYKLISGTWVEINTNLSTKIGVIGNLYSWANHNFNGYFLTYSISYEGMYTLYAAKWINETTIGDFLQVAPEAPITNAHIPLRTFKETSNTDHFLVLDKSQSVHKIKSLRISSGTIQVISSQDTPVVFSSGTTSNTYNSGFSLNSDRDAFYSLYGAETLDEVIYADSSGTDRNIFKITFDSGGSILSLEMVNKHTTLYTGSFFPLSTQRGSIDLDSSWNSYSGRLFVNPSKVILPNLANPSTNLTYRIKVKSSE